jgi:DHA1 family inner membrane transport protein
LSALTRKQVLLTLAIGAVGSGGLFSVFSYVKPTMTELAQMPVSWIPAVLALFGLGMIIGNIAGGRLADRGIEKTIRILLIWSFLVLSAFVFAVHYALAGAINVMMVGTMVALAAVLQIRLMDVAGDAQTMAAAMNHSAFNLANALGAWLGGVTISAGLGWQSTGWVGAILAVLGLLIHAVAMRDARRKSITFAHESH